MARFFVQVLRAQLSTRWRRCARASCALRPRIAPAPARTPAILLAAMAMPMRWSRPGCRGRSGPAPRRARRAERNPGSRRIPRKWRRSRPPRGPPERVSGVVVLSVQTGMVRGHGNFIMGKDPNFTMLELSFPFSNLMLWSKLFIPTLRERPGGRRGPQPQAAAARRIHPPAFRREFTVTCFWRSARC